MAVGRNCPKSFSREHAGIPISRTRWKCVHCGRTFKTKVPR